MGEILIPRRTKVEKGYELLADITVGTATTSVDITGLNIGKGDEVVLVGSLYRDSGSGTNGMFIYFNGNITDSNYYRQYISADGTSVSGVRDNDPLYSVLGIGDTAYSSTQIKLTNSGYVVYQANISRSLGVSALRMYNCYGTTTYTTALLTSIRISHGAIDAIGIGSRFQLYKVN